MEKNKKINKKTEEKSVKNSKLTLWLNFKNLNISNQKIVIKQTKKNITVSINPIFDKLKKFKCYREKDMDQQNIINHKLRRNSHFLIWTQLVDLNVDKTPKKKCEQNVT